MVTVKNSAGHKMTISEKHWKSLKKYQAEKTQDQTQVYKEVKAEQKSESKSKSNKS